MQNAHFPHGDGDVAARAGGPFWEARPDAKALRDGLLCKISGLGGRKVSHGCQYGDSAVVWGPSFVWGRNDGWEISHAEIATRLEIYNHFNDLSKHNPAIKDGQVYVAETPPSIGIRQTRFIEGEYKLVASDALEGRRFDDVVAISSCPVISYYGYRRYLTHEGYDIPYRCLVPLKVDNLLVAGRCISSEQEPYESHRAMAPIMAIGQAAGVAAALASKHGVKPRAMRVHGIQNELIVQGAELRKK